MLTKLSNEDMIKGFINDYTKIKDEFKKFLKSEGFLWRTDWKRDHFHGTEGAWINYVNDVIIRIRWGKVDSSAFIYTNVEYLNKIGKFLTVYKVVKGFSSPNEDYLILNDVGVANKTTSEPLEESKVDYMTINEIVNILKSGMPDLNDIQKKAVDRAIYYIEHSPME